MTASLVPSTPALACLLLPASCRDMPTGGATDAHFCSDTATTETLAVRSPREALPSTARLQLCARRRACGSATRPNAGVRRSTCTRLRTPPNCIPSPCWLASMQKQVRKMRRNCGQMCGRANSAPRHCVAHRVCQTTTILFSTICAQRSGTPS